MLFSAASLIEAASLTASCFIFSSSLIFSVSNHVFCFDIRVYVINADRAPHASRESIIFCIFFILKVIQKVLES